MGKRQIAHIARSKGVPRLASAVRRSIAPRAPCEPTVSVIIPVWNERKTIREVVRQAFRVHPETEVIVVANGTQDGSDRVAARLGAQVVSIPYPLGHDVGRAVGAMHAKGDILLFVDGDMVLKASELRPFVHAVKQGVDVALNHYSGNTDTESVHGVVLAKHALSVLLQRTDLHGTSLTAVPHALSRKALHVIGVEQLQVPPLAQAIAHNANLVIKPVHLVPVGKRNPLRKRRWRKNTDPLEQLVVGDHLEALNWLTHEGGARGGFEDSFRKREIVR